MTNINNISNLVSVCMDMCLKTELRQRKRSSDALVKFTNAIEFIISDAISHAHLSPDMSCSLALDKFSYSENNRYAPPGISYTQLSSAYRSLKAAGLIREVKRGYLDRDRQKGARTRFSASEKLREMCDLNSLYSEILGKKPLQMETIILGRKDNQKRVNLQYTDTDDTNRMRANLSKINWCLSRCRIALEIPKSEFNQLNERLKCSDDKTPINFAQKYLRRIFTDGRFDRGGRFYGGWWQNVPKEYRPFITLDWKLTCEYDFSQMNPHLAYMKVGKHLGEEDAYSRVFGEENREIVKRAFNAMLNATHRLSRAPRGLDLSGCPFRWAELRDAIAAAHKPIESLFYSGVGTELQFLDSQIAEGVMLHFANLESAPVLPIHDSFIMHHAYGETLGELEEAMRKSYFNITGGEITTKGKIGSCFPLNPRFREDSREEFCDWFNQLNLKDAVTNVRIKL